jgi:hypothetical protein
MRFGVSVVGRNLTEHEDYKYKRQDTNGGNTKERSQAVE